MQYAVRMIAAPKTLGLTRHTQFDDSQVIPRDNLPRAIQAIISSLATPDSHTAPNDLVLVGHGLQDDLYRLQESGISASKLLICRTARADRCFSAQKSQAMFSQSI